MNLSRRRMGRNKVKLEFIENDSSRKTTFSKRVKGVLRKTQELSVMCGVDACVVIYGPYSQAPVVWPSSEAETRRILTNFKRKPDIDQSQRQFNLEAFLKESVAKAQEKLLRLQRKNREMEMENIITEVIHGRMTFEEVPPSDLRDLLWVLEDKMRSIDQRQNLANYLPPNANNCPVPVQGNGAGSSSTSSFPMPLQGNGAGASSSSSFPMLFQDNGAGESSSSSFLVPVQDNGTGASSSSSYRANDDYGLSAIVNQRLTINEPQLQTQTQAQAQALAKGKGKAQIGMQ